MKSTLVILFNLFLVCNSIHAIDVKGRIIDMKTKKPVEFVTVVLLKSDSTYIEGCQTDAGGSFSIAGEFRKDDYLIKASYLGYRTTFIKISNLSTSLELGDLEMEEESQLLNEVTISANRIINKVDRQIILPDSMQLKSSVNAFDLLDNLSLSRIIIDPVNQTIKVGNDEVQLRINGVRANVREITGLRAGEILRVEYFEDLGVRYGGENVGAVINLIVNRQKNYGGYFSLDARNSPYVGFGNDSFTLKNNYKASEFGLNYFVNYRSYGDRWSNQTETLNFPDNPITRKMEGVKAPMQYQYHQVNLTYNLTSVDKYVFNVVFRNDIYDYSQKNLYNIIYSNEALQTFSNSKRKGFEYTPALDLYYKRHLKNKQTLEVNVVGTYIDSNSKNWYTESREDVILSDIANRVEGNKYSIIGEVIYEKQLEKHVFSAGAKYTHGYADNLYSGNTAATNSMKNSQSYAFAQIQGKLAGKLGYNVGLGGTHLWYKEGEKDALYYIFRPSVQLNYPFNDNFSVKYNFTVNSGVPTLGLVTSVEQEIDAYQINRGNPNLKPYKLYRNRLMLNFNKGKFSGSSTLGYDYYNKFFFNTYHIENNKIVSYYDNHKKFHNLSLWVNLTARVIKDIWTVDFWGSVNRSIFKSNQGTTSTYTGIFGGFRSNLQYKNYHLVVGGNSRYKNMWGEYIQYGEDWNYIEAGYKYNQARFSVGMSYPFKDVWSAGSRNISPVKPSESWTYIKENGHMLYFRLSWNISYGRKHKAGAKGLDNADSDKGTL